MPTRFDRVMFALLVPGIALVAIGATLIPLVPTSDSANGLWLVHLVFLYLLLGSVAVNGWMALRHPLSWTLRALPRKLGQVNAGLYAAIIVFLVISVAGMQSTGEGYPWGPVIVVAVVIMVLSIWSWVLIVARGGAYEAESLVTSLPLSRRALLVIGGYLGLAVTVAVLSLTAQTPTAVTYWAFPLMLLGLPWSHPVFLVVTLPLAAFGQGIPVFLLTLFAPIAANAALAVLLLAVPRARVRLVNWFFRLGRRVARAPRSGVNDEEPATAAFSDNVTGPLY